MVMNLSPRSLSRLLSILTFSHCFGAGAEEGLEGSDSVVEACEVRRWEAEEEGKNVSFLKVRTSVIVYSA